MSTDTIIHLVEQELIRQTSGINLIASENYCSDGVRSVVGSPLMSKYVEGTIGKRYYSGFFWIDQIELEVVRRFKTLFGADHVNAQPHSGTQANMAVYYAALKPEDVIFSMNLAHGGHLSHGHPKTLVGSLYKIVHYGVNEAGYIDYEEVLQRARLYKPKLIIAGASAYSRIVDFKAFRAIADDVGALLLADIAHTAGLVAAGIHPSPVPYADFITMTTHKTFRGPRGGIIMCRKEWADIIDKALMPGIQGGAAMNSIAAKGVAAHEAMSESFIDYQQNVVEYARSMAEAFQSLGYPVVSGGTDTHLFLLDLTHTSLTGKQVEQELERCAIFVNRNMIPGDQRSPLITSGIRIGTAAMTTVGYTMEAALKTVSVIDSIIQSMRQGVAIEYDDKKAEVRDILKLCYQSLKNI